MQLDSPPIIDELLEVVCKLQKPTIIPEWDAVAITFPQPPIIAEFIEEHCKMLLLPPIIAEVSDDICIWLDKPPTIDERGE